MLIYTYQKSKKKKKTKKEIAQYQQWLDSINSQKTNFSKKTMGKITFDPMAIPKLSPPPGRETVKYPSVVTPGGACTKPIRGTRLMPLRCSFEFLLCAVWFLDLAPPRSRRPAPSLSMSK